MFIDTELLERKKKGRQMNLVSFFSVVYCVKTPVLPLEIFLFSLSLSFVRVCVFLK